MNCRVNIAAVVSGDIGISCCQEVSTTPGEISAVSLRIKDTGWGLKQDTIAHHKKCTEYKTIYEIRLITADSFVIFIFPY